VTTTNGNMAAKLEIVLVICSLRVIGAFMLMLLNCFVHEVLVPVE